MERVEKTVFLSYRRTNLPWALAIFQNLTNHGYDVFFDYDGIASGDFERVILTNITSRAHFLVLLTPSALERCDDAGDWLRREIETALSSKRNTIPLMLEGFDFGTPTIAGQLTGDLAALKHYNGLSIPPAYFLEAMERLRTRYLSVPLTAVLHPAPISAQRAATEQKAAAGAAAAVLEEALTAQQCFERALASTDREEKLRLYSEAIRLNPTYSYAYHNRGVNLDHSGDAKGALRDYEEAIRLNPKLSDAYIGRGNSRYGNGDFEGALRDFEESIRLDPKLCAAYIGRGNCRYLHDDLEGASGDYEEAIRLDPRQSDAYNGRSLVRRDQGDKEAALRDVDEALRLDPANNYAARNRAKLLKSN